MFKSDTDPTDKIPHPVNSVLPYAFVEEHIVV